MNKPLILCASALALLSFACTAPTRDLNASEIEAITELEELMYVKATVADPCFKLAKGLAERAPTDAEWAAFEDMGARLQVTSRQGLRFSMGPEFDAYLGDLERLAADLEDAASRRDQLQSVGFVGAIKDVCAACHDDFR